MGAKHVGSFIRKISPKLLSIIKTQELSSSVLQNLVPELSGGVSVNTVQQLVDYLLTRIDTGDGSDAETTVISLLVFTLRDLARDKSPIERIMNTLACKSKKSMFLTTLTETIRCQ